jgi:hypothetical protein
MRTIVLFELFLSVLTGSAALWLYPYHENVIVSVCAAISILSGLSALANTISILEERD